MFLGLLVVVAAAVVLHSSNTVARQLILCSKGFHINLLQQNPASGTVFMSARDMKFSGICIMTMMKTNKKQHLCESGVNTT